MSPAQSASWKQQVWLVVILRTMNFPSDADIFPEALQSPEEFRDFASEIDLPLLANMTEFGKSPLLSFQDLAGFGYRMVIFPQSAFRVSMKATEEFLRALKESGTQKESLDRMQTRQELYQLLNYDPTAEKWLGQSD